MRIPLLFVLILVASTAAVLSVPAGCDSFTETTLHDGTGYGYETFGNDHATYRCTVNSVVTDLEGLYISTTLEGYNVTEIGDGAIRSDVCRYIVIPDHVMSIGSDVFGGCPLLESVYFLGDRPIMPEDAVPEGVSVYHLQSSSGWTGGELMEEMFYRDSGGSSTRYCIIEGSAMVLAGTPAHDGSVAVLPTVGGVPVESIAAYAFAGTDVLGMEDVAERTDIRSVSIPDTVRTIRERAFYYNTGLESVDIPDSVEAILDEAFRAATGLRQADIGGSVTYMGFECFRHCVSLESISVPDSVVFMGEGVFKVCSSMGSVELGSRIGSIPDWAFSYCSSMEDISFGGEVVNVGDSAFYMCSSLGSVTMPDSVESIGADAFYGCEGLGTIGVGRSLTTIGGSAFEGCSVLDDVRLPATLDSIGDRAFAYCQGMENIRFEGDMPEFGRAVFLDTDAVIHCTPGSEGTWAGYDGKVVADLGDGGDDIRDNTVVTASAIIAILVVASVSVCLYRRMRRGRILHPVL